MEIHLYQTEDPDTTINKDLDLISVIEIELKDPNNVTSPSIILEEIPDVDLKTINYAYLPEFMRYYFVRHLNVGPNNVYQLMLECDVLETFKADILNSSAEITRSIQTDDYGDIVASAEVRKEVDIFNSNKGFKQEETIVFSTIGQIIEGGI